MDKKRPKIIAVDFDGTLCENRWPEIGAENTPIIKELIQHREDGDKLILYTCRTGNLLDAAVLWCKARGLEFDALNENLPEQIWDFGGDCRKIYADEYWDDKSVIVCAKGVRWIARLVSEHLQVKQWKEAQIKPRETGFRKWLDRWR